MYTSLIKGCYGRSKYSVADLEVGIGFVIHFFRKSLLWAKSNRFSTHCVCVWGVRVCIDTCVCMRKKKASVISYIYTLYYTVLLSTINHLWVSNSAVTDGQNLIKDKGIEGMCVVSMATPCLGGT